MIDEEWTSAWNPAPFRAALESAGYTHGRLKELDLLRPGDPFGRATMVSHLLPADHPLAVLCHLFDSGDPVRGADALAVFGNEMTNLLRAGLIEPLGSQFVRSPMRLEPVEEGWFASDHPSALLNNRADYTMGVGKSTRLLAALVPSRPGAAALDLCSGSGWVALGLARAGCRTTASDLNHRALGFARFNAALLGAPPVEFRQGDLFEPLGERRFDLIASNPPFVISPDSTFTFRDSGCKGDSFCENLARRMPDHLAGNGIGIMLLNWVDGGDGQGDQRPLSWLEGSGCGAWLFQAATAAPADYAYRWLRESGRGRMPDPAELDRWIGYFKEIGARAIHSGFLLVHRTPGRPWRRFEAREMEDLKGPAGEEVRRVVAGEAWLADQEPDEATLLKGRFRVVDGITAQTEMILDRGWQARTVRLRSPSRLSYDGQIDEFLLRLLDLCRAQRPPADMVSELQAKPHFASRAELPGQVAGLVRELIRHGLLAPTDD